MAQSIAEAVRAGVLVVTTDERALRVPGAVVVVDPERADEMGAFQEDALSPEDAAAAIDEEA